MQDLYKHEHDAIVDIVNRVRVKYMDGSDVNFEKLERLHRELSGRLEDAGFESTVDVTPLLEGMPPVVAIIGRHDPMREFDHERKAHEVRKRRERKDDEPQIEGVV
jgi:Icc-related predicted phosphoesterase